MGIHRQGSTTLAAFIALAFGQAAWAQSLGDSSAGAAGTAGGTAPSDSGGTSGNGPQGLRFLPGIRFSQYYSDNPLGRPSGQETGGFTTEVSPYVRASVGNRRAQGNLDLMIRNFYHTEPPPGGDSVDTLRYALGANGRITDSDGRLGISGYATVRDISLAPFGVTAVDPSVVQVNRARASSLALSPYVNGRFGTVADYSANYRITTSHVEGNTGLLPQADHSLNGRLSSGPEARQWGWSMIARAQRRDYEGGFNVGRKAAIANLYYAFLPGLRVGALLTYDQVDGLKNSDGEDSGIGPGFSLDWTPTPRTRMNAKWSQQYYGPTSSVRFSHRMSRWFLSADYFNGVSTYNNATVGYYNPASLVPGSGSTVPQDPTDPSDPSVPALGTTSPDATVLVPGLVADAASYMKRLNGSIRYSLPRGSAGLSFFAVQRDTAVANPAVGTSSGAFSGELRQYGGSLILTHSLTARSSLFLTGGLNQSDSNSSGAQSKQVWMQATYSTRLTTDATAGMGLRRNVQSGSGGAPNYDVNTVFGILDLQF